eukprot:TRINITY_DN277_c0_g1_i2.p1 TRINITY_DN277_c0_g1~~TRINITY_DN277_c0_g1_i2.p1  ORF type:complete len:349 (-),score=91.07 TRINITY_DN277_c0_g1_i2:270-1316(-)
MKGLYVILLIALIEVTNASGRGEWYESYKEDLVPKHVPVEAPRIPRVHGVSRGEWHIVYAPVVNRRNSGDGGSAFVSRIRDVIRRRLSPLRGMLRVKRDEGEDFDYTAYQAYDQYPVESNESPYTAREDESAESSKPSFFDRFRENLSKMMANVRSFFSLEDSEAPLNSLDRENAQGHSDDSFPGHHQHHPGQHNQQFQENYPESSLEQPSVIERMRRDFSSMIGRIMSVFGGNNSKVSKVHQQEDEFQDQFDYSGTQPSSSHPSASSSSFEYSHERNYGHIPPPQRNSPSLLDGLKESLNWVRNSLLGRNGEGYYPGAPLPAEAYVFEPTERRFQDTKAAQFVIPPK